MTSQILYYAYKIYNNGGGSTVWLQLLPSTKNMISVGFLPQQNVSVLALKQEPWMILLTLGKHFEDENSS